MKLSRQQHSTLSSTWVLQTRNHDFIFARLNTREAYEIATQDGAETVNTILNRDLSAKEKKKLAELQEKLRETTKN